MGPHSLKNLTWRVCLIFATVMSGISCSQYDYTSPEPGILEIRLKAKNSRQDFMPFGNNNSFFFNLKRLEVFRSDNVRLTVLPDLNAIRRDDDGDLFNALDTLARDSVYILGRTYAAPGDYKTIDILAQLGQGQGSFVLISGVLGIPTFIPVTEPIPQPDALNSLPRDSQTLSVRVNEGRTTRVNVMLDLDSTLVRLAESFQGDLQFYVSSIQNN